MKISDMLKTLLPPPRIPQKRYLVIIGLALYYAAKVYTASTPSPVDDDILERIKDLADALTV